MLPISLKRILPLIACLIAWNAQAEIINYTFTGVMKGTSPNGSSKANVKTGDTFELAFSIDTNATPTSRGPQYGTTYVNGVNILSSTLTITSASSSIVTVDLTSPTGTLLLSHVYNPGFGEPYDSFVFSSSLPENTYIDQGTPTASSYYLTSIGLTLKGPLDTLTMDAGGEWPLFPETLTLSDWDAYNTTAPYTSSSLEMTFQQGSTSGISSKYGEITGTSAALVPEPATYAALFAAATFAVAVIRRRRK
ncbi:PEP-CTERM sorting domain-containing protein [Ruficoccus amylovorans]|uniref:PEP-CTERM sorting domain-containing protein n=1 Tax=Ruficoccus amylovorans TaxID=1804625 RepID=A0A842HGD0_9BACT|nr:PEP-CTERM sorting domain-containing protein [Ruficoccus amylovorans]MBC2594686.1 PEP-CTERM sorting domain-containing protein [Ruficoccus amylovorans]